MDTPDSSNDDTACIRTQVEQSGQREHAVPMYLTSSFTFNDSEQARALFADEEEGNIYSRFTNPNVEEFEEKICALEELPEGLGTASGMAAVFTTFAALLGTGDEVLSSRYIFGSTHKLFTQVFPKWGISHTYGDLNNLEEWDDLVTDDTKLVYVETPSNPTVDLIDLEWMGEFCDRHDLIYIVDNCFASPALQKPARYGADLVIHSATKYIDGQGRGVGGVVVGTEEYMEPIQSFARHSGPALSPFNAWMFSKSLETLDVRMKKHSDSALAIARHLEERDDVKIVRYPFLESHPQYDLAQKQMSGGGGVLSFAVEGGIERGADFLDALEMCSLTANLGDSRTIATHPASTTHSKLSEEERRGIGILPGLVRVSVGLEAPEDIAADLDQALERSA
ncbi:MAG: O-succinylhomoserine sulfhydrylase [Bacteroidetes bacterium SW_9_63_38]|nr:MAG: O-succinylhomoserine sulfhydrylase [Bacteroidetes bacterium SW_9_63_38]